MLEAYPHTDAVSTAISPDNRRVLTGGRDDVVNVWSGQSGRRVHTLTDHTGRPTALAFSPDGSFVASASADGSGRVWRTVDWGLQSTLGGHALALTDVDFSTDGDHVVTSSVDGTARVLTTESGSPLVVLAGNKGWVTSAAFAGPAGTSVVTSSVDGSARVWDATFQPDLAELAALGAPVDFIEVGEDRIRVEAAGKTHVLDADSGDVVETERGTRPHGRVVGPNGVTAVIRRNTVVLRGPAGRRIVLEGHRDDVEVRVLLTRRQPGCDREPRSRRADMGCRDGRGSRLAVAAQLRGARRPLQPRRQMDRHRRREGSAVRRAGWLSDHAHAGTRGTADLGRLRS